MSPLFSTLQDLFYGTFTHEWSLFQNTSYHYKFSLRNIRSSSIRMELINLTVIIIQTLATWLSSEARRRTLAHNVQTASECPYFCSIYFSSYFLPTFTQNCDLDRDPRLIRFGSFIPICELKWPKGYYRTTMRCTPILGTIL